MDQQEKHKQTFPKGFEYVQERLDETTQHLNQLDSQIQNTPKEKGPTLEYHPPHFVGRFIPGSRDKTRKALEEKQHEIKLDALNKTDADTREVASPSGRVVRDRVREQLFPNPYRQLSPEDRLDQKSVPKEMEQSQDYMDAMLRSKEQTPKEMIQPSQAISEKKATSHLSMSARFSTSLSYTKAVEGNAGPSTPSPNRQPDKERD